VGAGPNARWATEVADVSREGGAGPSGR